MAKVPQECLNYDFIKTLKDLLIDVIIEKEKSGYIIGSIVKNVAYWLEMVTQNQFNCKNCDRQIYATRTLKKQKTLTY